MEIFYILSEPFIFNLKKYKEAISSGDQTIKTDHKLLFLHPYSLLINKLDFFHEINIHINKHTYKCKNIACKLILSFRIVFVRINMFCFKLDIHLLNRIEKKSEIFGERIPQ